MPTYQGRLITCLILSTLSATSWADTVLVNITADKTADDKECSIREAVSYLSQKNIKKTAIDADTTVINHNIGLLRTSLSTKQLTLTLEQSKADADQDKPLIASLTKEIDDPDTGLKKQISTKETEVTVKEKELADFRDKGINGCRSEVATSVDSIKLNKSTTAYEVNSVININISTSFLPESDTVATGDLSNLEKSGSSTEARTVIKAIGNHAIFMIDDGLPNDPDNKPSTPLQYITVTFNNIDFQGCGTSACAANGGIIFNKEDLVINSGIISGGVATGLGGAIFNDINALFSGDQLLIKNNQANDGAAIYSEQSSLFITNSLFTKNTASNTNAIVSVGNKSVNLRLRATPSITNSTFSGNIGTAISSKSTFSLKSLTIVLNSRGINFNNETPILYNSIVTANSDQDCVSLGTIPNDTNTYMAYNVYQKGCELVPATLAIEADNPSNQKLASTEKIIADTDINGKNTGGKCAAPPAKGLLCPLADNGGLTQSHKPRLLVEYKTVSESPIVNKGASNGADSISYLTCSTTDQRLLPRGGLLQGRCDIGAVELQGLISSKQGQDINAGQKAVFDLFEKIGDGELLPANQCAALFNTSGVVYKDGCVQLITSPTKGFVEFDNTNHQLLYTATLADFHGFDTFSYGLTTTISRFSDAKNDRSVKISVNVVSAPATGLTSKSLDTGSTGIFSLLMLSLLMVWRRIR